MADIDPLAVVDLATVVVEDHCNTVADPCLIHMLVEVVVGLQYTGQSRAVVVQSQLYVCVSV